MVAVGHCSACAAPLPFTKKAFSLSATFSMDSHSHAPVTGSTLGKRARYCGAPFTKSSACVSTHWPSPPPASEPRPHRATSTPPAPKSAISVPGAGAAAPAGAHAEAGMATPPSSRGGEGAPGHAAQVTGAPGAPESAGPSVRMEPVPSKAPLASRGEQSPRMNTVAPAGAARTAPCARERDAQGEAGPPVPEASLPLPQST